MGKYDNLLNEELNKITGNKPTSVKSSSRYDDLYNEELGKITSGKVKSSYKNYTYNKDAYIKQKNNETIQGLESNLLSNGVNVPLPDEELKPKRNWFEKYIGDPISALGYAANRGIKNAVDENANTSVLQGIKEGFGAGFKDENANMRTSFSEVLQTLLNNSNDGVRNTTAVVNNVLNPFAWKDAIEGKGAVETAKDHTGLTGFLGDALLDPANLIGGLGGASKVLSKGSKVLNGADTIGDVSKATDVLKSMGNAGDLTKEAEYLAKKTSKALGFIDDYKGITLGTNKHNITIPGLSAKNLGKVADTLPVRVVRNIGGMIGETKLAKDISSKFGGKYHKLMEYAKTNPDEAMKTVAYIDEYKKSLNNEMAEKLKHIKTTEEAQKVVKGYEAEITKAMETKNIVDEITQVFTVPSEARSEAMVKFRQKGEAKRAEIELQLKALNDEAAATTDLSKRLELQKQYEDLSDLNKTTEASIGMSDEELEAIYKRQVEITKKEGRAVDSQFDKVEPVKEIKPVETPKQEVIKSKDKSMSFSELTKKEDLSKLSEAERNAKELRDLKWSVNPTNKYSKAPLDKHEGINKRIKELEEIASKEKNTSKPKTAEEPKKLTQEERDKLVPIDKEVEVVKPTVDTKLEETYKKLGDKKLNDLTDEKYNELVNKHIEAKLPLDEEIKNRYKSMNKWEADEEIKFLNNKMANRRKMNTEHTVTNKAGKKLQGVIDYINELSEKAKVKPRFDLESEDFYEANIGFRNIEKARMERKLFEKGKKLYASTGEVTDRMAESLTDALTNSFKDSKWIGEAGDDLTRDLKFLTKREFDTVWDSVKKANNKPYESKKFKNFSSFNDDEKVIGKNEAITGKNRDNWIDDMSAKKDDNEENIFDYTKRLMETEDGELANMPDTLVHGIIERDLDKAVDDLDIKEAAKEFNEARAKALPLTDKQLNAISYNVRQVKWYRPEVYKQLRETMGGSFRNIKSRYDARQFFDKLKEISDNFGTKALDVKAETKYRKELVDLANRVIKENTDEAGKKNAQTILDLFSKGKVSNYNQYARVKDGLNAYVTKETFEKAVKETRASEDVTKAYKALETTPVEAIKETVKDPVVAVQMVQTKTAVDTISNAIEELKKVKDLKVSQLEAEYKRLNNLLNDEKLFEAHFDKQFGNKYPKYVEQIKTTYKVTGGQFDKLPTDVKAVAEHFQNEFKKYGIEEGIITQEEADGLYNYVAHMQSPEGKKYFDSVETNSSVKNPINKNAIERTAFPKDWTIEKINEFMLEKHGVKNYMEDQISRIYLQRSLAHNKYMFEKKRVDNFIETFGTKYDFNNRPAKGDKEGWAKYMEMVNDFQSKKGNGYSIVTLDEAYSPIDVTTLEGKSLEDALNHNINSSPFVQIDPKDIKEEKFYENVKQPLYVVPSDMHKEYLDVMKGQYEQQAGTLKGMYTKFVNLWKAQALFSTSYHVNNMQGNMFNGYLNVGSKIFNPKYNSYSSIALMAKNSKVMGDKVFLGRKASEWLDIAKEYGVLGHTQTDVDMVAFRNGLTDVLKETKSPLKKFASKINPLNVSHDAGNIIEEQARLTNFFIHIADGKTPQEASDMVNKFLFDYSDLSQFEQNTMKNIMPFYTWFRKNLPLQVSQLFEQPTKYGRIYKGQKSVSKKESEDQKKYKPEYLENSIHLGEGKYAKLNLPYEDLKKATSVNDLVSGTNPFAKLAVELITNKNLYYNSPIAKQDGEMVKAPLYLEPFAKNTPNGKMIDAKLKYALDSLLPAVKNTSNAVNTKVLGKGTEAEASRADGFLKGVKVQEPDFEQLKQQAVFYYIKKLTDAETNAKKEGKITKTAEQIQKQKESDKQYQKIKDIYENNYVIKKKK